MSEHTDYIQAINVLLGYVGKEVLVSAFVEDAPYLVAAGRLRHGEGEALPRREEDDEPWAQFGLGDHNTAGIYLSAAHFIAAHERENGLSIELRGARLEIWQSPGSLRDD